MANVQINLQAVTQQFVTSMQQASTLMNQVVGNLGTLNTNLAQTQKQFTQTGQQAQQASTHIRTAGAAAQQSGGHFNGLGNSAAFAAGKFLVLLRAAETVTNALVTPFKDAVENIDQFTIATIGTASAITNLAAEGVRFGKDYQAIFKQNVAATRGAFTELETISANFFASSKDLQLAYFSLAQRGVVIRREEFNLLGKTVDQILLLTQGQNSAIQVQEELRNLIAGTLRPTSQLVQLIKAFGLDVKQVAAEIKATQSLKPLEPILKGAIEATTEVQKTFLAAKNSFDSFFNQVRRSGFDAFFTRINEGLVSFVAFLRAHQDQVAGFINIFGSHAAGIIESFLATAKSVIETLTDPKGIKPDNPLIIFAGAISAFIQNIPRLIQYFVAFIEVLFQLPAIFEKAFGDGTTANIASTGKEAAKATQEIANARKELSAFERVKEGLEHPVDAIKRGGSAALGGVLHPFDTIAKGADTVGTGVVDVVKKTTGLDATTKSLGRLGVAMEGVGESFRKATANISAFVTTEQATKKITDDFAKGLEKSNKDRAQAKNAPLPFPSVTPTPQTEEELKDLQHRANAILDLKTRIARTQRENELHNIRLSGRAALDEIRRQDVLIRQGFLVTTGTGTASGLTTNQAIISQGVFDNLRQQLEQVDKELKQFKKEAEDEFQTAISLKAAKLFKDADDLAKEADAQVKKTVEDTTRDINAATAHVETLERLQGQQLRPEDLQKQIDSDVTAIDRLKSELEELQAKGDEAAKRVASAVVEGAAEAVGLHQQTLLKPGQNLAPDQLHLATGFDPNHPEELGLGASPDQAKLGEFLNADRLAKAEEEQGQFKERSLDLTQQLAAAEAHLTRLKAEQSVLSTGDLEAEVELAKATRDNIALQGLANVQKAEADRLVRFNKVAQIEELANEETKFQKQKQIGSVLNETNRLRLEANKIIADGNSLVAQQLRLLQAERTQRKDQNKTLQQEKLTPVQKEQADILGDFNTTRNTFKQFIQSSGIKQEFLKGELSKEQAKPFADQDPKKIDAINAAINDSIEAVQAAGNEFTNLIAPLADLRLAFAQTRAVFEGVRDATRKAFDSLVTALTDSFEGKRTDFVRIAKNFADDLVKASLKNVGESIAQTMAQTLGPAFVAGFALIASFVLGQILNKNSSKASAGNPKVGIQSSEQVRGLIGGETSIPIGQIGESLQSAFVPTNALLLRIASGVERLGTLGITLDTVGLESSLNSAFGNALQAQTSTV